MKLAAGTMVNPRVRLLEPLGRGAMGSVWTGEHLTLDTEVAVKFIKPELAAADGDGLLERFKREAKAAAQIKSPHVVQTFDQGFMDDGTPYIVMELLDGETLGERLDRSGPMSLRETAEIVSQVCRGLTKAHELGIVHRDIKPDNLFLVGAGEDLLVKILDFGVAKQVQLPAGAATASGTLVGTPQYMSPEQLLRAEKLQPLVDLWALAAVAYQAMVGRPPFEGETLAGIIVAITHGKFARPSSVDERLSGPMDEWIDRALALEPQDRFATAKELAESFRAAVERVQAADPSLTTVAAEAPQPSATAPSAETKSELAATAEFIADAELDVKSEAGPLSKPVDVPNDAPGAVGAATPDRDDDEAGPAQAQTMRSLDGAPSAGGRGGWRMPAAVALVVLMPIAYFAFRPNSSDRPVGPALAPSPAASDALASGTTDTAAAALPTTVPSSADGGARTDAASAFAGGEPLRVPAGRTPDESIWLPAFGAVRPEGGQGKSYVEAQAACRDSAMALCTEAQWQRLCAQAPEAGQDATWTASAVGDEGFVVRGGDGTCRPRQVVAPADRSSDRAALCCTRVVAIRSANESPAFLESTATKLGRIESAFSTGNTALLSSLVGDNVRYRDVVLRRKAFVDKAAKMFQVGNDSWILHDVCAVALFEEDGGHAWSADCGCVVQQGRRLGHWLRRYVHDGSTGKLRSVEVPKVFRAAAPP